MSLLDVIEAGLHESLGVVQALPGRAEERCRSRRDEESKKSDDLRQGPSAEIMSARRDGQCWLHAIAGAPASWWREPTKATIYNAADGMDYGRGS